MEWVAIPFSRRSSQPRDHMPSLAQFHCSIDDLISSFQQLQEKVEYLLPHLTLGAKIPKAQDLRDLPASAAKQGLYHLYIAVYWLWREEQGFSSVAQSYPTLCDPMNCSTPGLPLHHQLPEFTQTNVHWVGDAIQPSHPLSSPSPPALNPSWHQGLFQWVNSSHEVAKVLEFQLEHQSFQWTPRTDFLYDGLVGSPCSPRDSQESSPTPQFKSINSSALSFLYGPTLTSIHDYWENHSFD